MLAATLIVLFTVLSVRWLDAQRTPWLRKLLDWLPAILFAYLIPAAITHSLHWDLSKVYLHTLSKEWIIPLAILSVMSALPFQQLRIIGFKPILLFVFGSFVIASLPVVLVWAAGWWRPDYHTLFIDEAYWKGLPPIVGGWIGGSTSQLVLKELAECPEALFLSILVLDNILVNIWTILMFQFIKRSDQLNRYFGIDNRIPDMIPDELAPNVASRRSTFAVLGIIAGIVVLTYFLVPSFLGKIVLLSFVGLMLGNFIPWWDHTLVIRLGGVLIVTIMA
ncbi:MAG: DUF819 family protein, partial [Lewinella sp.]|nr:DUF819 family protein [Lewinella sp.]